MILRVRVTPKASHVRIVPIKRSGNSNVAGRNFVKEENSCLKVYLTKPAEGGLANAQLIDLLAEHLRVKKYQIKIIQGLKSRDKVIEVDAHILPPSPEMPFLVFKSIGMGRFPF